MATPLSRWSLRSRQFRSSLSPAERPGDARPGRRTGEGSAGILSPTECRRSWRCAKAVSNRRVNQTKAGYPKFAAPGRSRRCSSYRALVRWSLHCPMRKPDGRALIAPGRAFRKSLLRRPRSQGNRTRSAPDARRGRRIRPGRSGARYHRRRNRDDRYYGCR